MKVIEIKNLSKSYKNIKALNNLSLDIDNNIIFGLLGPNGSGKSTLINCILGLLNYEKGSIKIFDKDIEKVKSEIGVVFQDVAVFDELTVYENIDYFCGLYIKNKKIRKQYINDAIKLVGLEKFIKFYPKQLSGGLLRRLNIACGIAHKPKLIFLDEPTVAVDPQSRNNILEGIKKLNKDGATIIYTTHYMEEVEELCDDIAILDKGKVIARGTCNELKKLTNIKEKITIEADIPNDILNKIKNIKNIKEVTYKNKALNIVFEDNNNLEPIIDFLKNNKIKYNNIQLNLPTLNDVFLNLTGKELRDV